MIVSHQNVSDTIIVFIYIPQEYRPERFSATNAEQVDSFAFIPFSAGPRYDSH